MIARLRGTVISRTTGEVVVDCAGVGYSASVSDQTLAAVPPEGGEVTLVTRLVVRDDSMSIYGFATDDERELFAMLLGVPSVGPKLALAVVGSAPTANLLKSIAAGDAARLQSIPGVGKRTAERICLDLKEQAGALGVAAVDDLDADARGEARSALLALGMGEREVEELLDRVGDGTAEEMIQRALRESKKP